LDYTLPISETKAETFFTNDTKSAVDAVNKLSLPSCAELSQTQFEPFYL
jgi:hypothetical protein